MDPFRFGVVCTGLYTASSWTELARRAEGEGFSTLLVADHYVNPMACGPLLMAAASATTTLRVGSYVYCNDFRSPALLAKEAATIDVLSDGRFELGVGAGWVKLEYVAAGLHFDPPGVRVRRLEESVQIIRRLLAGDSVEHRGEYYRLRGLPGAPLPVQRPLPILIGGGGPRMTRFAAQAADIVAFIPQALPDGGLDPSKFGADEMDRKIAWLEDELASCERDSLAGPVPERSVLLFDVGGSGEHDPHLVNVDPLTRVSSPHVLRGAVAEMAEALHERRERWGLSYIVCVDRDLEALTPVIDAVQR